MKVPDPVNCYLFVFDSTHQALRGEEVLKQAGIPHEVVSTPPRFKTGCGISLRVRPEAREKGEEPCGETR